MTRPRIAIASDHTGYRLKEVLGRHPTAKGYAVEDLGTDSAAPVDRSEVRRMGGTQRNPSSRCSRCRPTALDLTLSDSTCTFCARERCRSLTPATSTTTPPRHGFAPVDRLGFLRVPVGAQQLNRDERAPPVAAVVEDVLGDVGGELRVDGRTDRRDEKRLRRHDHLRSGRFGRAARRRLRRSTSPSFRRLFLGRFSGRPPGEARLEPRPERST